MFGGIWEITWKSLALLQRVNTVMKLDKDVKEDDNQRIGTSNGNFDENLSWDRG